MKEHQKPEMEEVVLVSEEAITDVTTGSIPRPGTNPDPDSSTPVN